jgi:hypothetical protein
MIYRNPNNSETHKWCPKCERKLERTAENFYRAKSKPDGFGAVCKECKDNYKKSYDKTDKAIKLRKERREKKMKNPAFRLRRNVSRSILFAIRREKGSKLGESVLKHLPYSQEELREHLESQFEDWMTWENYGNKPGCWSLDHIIPQKKLPYDSFEHPNFQRCWALENLRPLNHLENVRKKDKLIEEKDG